MPFSEIAVLLVSCLLVDHDYAYCVRSNSTTLPVQAIAGATNQQPLSPQYTGHSFDVVLTAASAIAWDENTNAILYEQQAEEKRPVASLSKILSALTVRDRLSLPTIVEIPAAAKAAQINGADIKLPIGHHASVYDLLSASLVASANDAMVTLAIATAGSENDFVRVANTFAKKNGAYHTLVSNSTGLSGGEQYSTAKDIKTLFSLAYRDKVLRNLLVTDQGQFETTEGKKITFKSTNKLLGTYFPILAAKTGYTYEAGENLAVVTYGKEGQRIGVIVLGSHDRFQDVKVLVEWIWRNYQWP